MPPAPGAFVIAPSTPAVVTQAETRPVRPGQTEPSPTAGRQAPALERGRPQVLSVCRERQAREVLRRPWVTRPHERRLSSRIRYVRVGNEAGTEHGRAHP